MKLEINKDQLIDYLKDVNFVEHEFDEIRSFLGSDFTADENHKILLEHAFLSFPRIWIYLVKDRRYIVIGNDVHMASRNVDIIPILFSSLDNYVYCNLM